MHCVLSNITHVCACLCFYVLLISVHAPAQHRVHHSSQHRRHDEGGLAFLPPHSENEKNHEWKYMYSDRCAQGPVIPCQAGRRGPPPGGLEKKPRSLILSDHHGPRCRMGRCRFESAWEVVSKRECRCWAEPRGRIPKGWGVISRIAQRRSHILRSSF